MSDVSGIMKAALHAKYVAEHVAGLENITDRDLLTLFGAIDDIYMATGIHQCDVARIYDLVVVRDAANHIISAAEYIIRIIGLVAVHNAIRAKLLIRDVVELITIATHADRLGAIDDALVARDIAHRIICIAELVVVHDAIQAILLIHTVVELITYAVNLNPEETDAAIRDPLVVHDIVHRIIPVAGIVARHHDFAHSWKVVSYANELIALAAKLEGIPVNGQEHGSV